MLLHRQELAESGDIILDVQELSMAFENKMLFHDLNLTIYKGEKCGVDRRQRRRQINYFEADHGAADAVSGNDQAWRPGQGRLL